MMGGGVRSNLDRIELESVVDPAREVDKYAKAVERLVEAKAGVEDVPSLDRCREYVEAHDALQALLRSATA